MRTKKQLIPIFFLVAIILGFSSIPVLAQTKTVSADFENGLASPTFIYHNEGRFQDGTEVVSNCSGRTAYEGTYYMHQGFYTGATDPCLGTTPQSVASWSIISSGSISSNTMVLRHRFRVTDHWKDQSSLGKMKWLRLAGGGYFSDTTSAHVHIQTENTTDVRFWLMDATEGTYSRFWGTAYHFGLVG